MTSGSSQRPGTIPASLIASITSPIPLGPGNLVFDGFHSPTLGHQSPESSYQPQSMTKTSQPTYAALEISGNSFSVVGSPFIVFI